MHFWCLNYHTQLSPPDCEAGDVDGVLIDVVGIVHLQLESIIADQCGLLLQEVLLNMISIVS